MAGKLKNQPFLREMQSINALKLCSRREFHPDEENRAELTTDLLFDSFQEGIVMFVPIGAAETGKEDVTPLLTRENNLESRFSRALRWGNPACLCHNSSTA